MIIAFKESYGGSKRKKNIALSSIYRIFGDKKKLFFFLGCWHRFLSLFLHAKMSNKKKKKRKVNKVDKKTRTKKVNYALACCNRKRLANVPLRMYRNKSATDKFKRFASLLSKGINNK